MVGLTLWKWVPVKVVGHIMISPNKSVSVEESVENRVSLEFLKCIITN